MCLRKKSPFFFTGLTSCTVTFSPSTTNSTSETLVSSPSSAEDPPFHSTKLLLAFMFVSCALRTSTSTSMRPASLPTEMVV